MKGASWWLAPLLWGAATIAWAMQPPPLPSGLGGAGEAPPLPTGLGDGSDRLPLGNGALEGAADSGDADSSISGSWDFRLGSRIQGDRLEDRWSLAEGRLQVRVEKSSDAASFRFAGDLLWDAVQSPDTRDRVRLEENEGFLDLREAAVWLHLSDRVDLKAGRQTLTWGTGDLLFINDLFPKDFQSFFLGRDETYLKAPSDALKVSLFGDGLNADLVYTPRFDADRFLDGRRISFYDAAHGRRVGEDAPIRVDKRNEWFEDDELAVRLFGNLSSYELAAYAYHGFWKSPAGVDPAGGRFTFPRLDVYGVSGRGPVAKGIGNIEFGYYLSGDDADGSDPLIRNSELRVLIGYEQEAARNFTVGVQYYVERLLDYDAYRSALPGGATPADRFRQVLTVRLTRLAWGQDLRLSLFAFYSPTDQDGYLKPVATYRLDDAWTLEVGGNLFFGKDARSFFGQLQDDSNLYLAMHMSFG